MAVDVAWIRNRFLARPHVLVDGTGRVNPLTDDAFAKGIYFIDKVTPEGIAKGIEYFTKAIDIEPNYAPAYAGLADVYNRAAIQNFRPAKEVYPAAKLAVSRALQLDDTLAEALIISGVIKFRFDWDWVGAERDLQAGLELNPSSSRAHLGYSTYLLTMKRIDDAVRIAQRNVELDPLTVQRHIDLAWKLSYAGRPDEAITHLKEALEIAPDSANVYGHLGSNYAAKQMFVDAIAMCERALNLQTTGFVTSDCGRVYVQAGRQREAVKVLQHLLSQSSVQQYGVARLYDALGDHEQALHWMVQAYEARAPEMCFLQIDTLSASLRADPRFQDILRRMRFPT
jgi:tetratricopeptide (TPR) repeat protein